MSSTLQAALDQKLFRSHEHINLFESECNAFLDEAPRRTLVGDDPEAEKALRDFHNGRPVPPRLSVIAGESIHQTRSCLDHIICALTKNKRSKLIVLDERPKTQKQQDDYERSLRGITQSAAREIIEKLQPYQDGARYRNHWLHILKGLSNTDKHRSLLMHVSVVTQGHQVTINKGGSYTLGTDGLPDHGIGETFIDPAISDKPIPVVDVRPRFTAQVAFDKWGDTGRIMRVSSGLRVLHDYVSRTLQELLPFVAQ